MENTPQQISREAAEEALAKYVAEDPDQLAKLQSIARDLFVSVRRQYYSRGTQPTQEQLHQLVTDTVWSQIVVVEQYDTVMKEYVDRCDGWFDEWQEQQRTFGCVVVRYRSSQEVMQQVAGILATRFKDLSQVEEINLETEGTDENEYELFVPLKTPLLLKSEEEEIQYLEAFDERLRILTADGRGTLVWSLLVN